MTPSPDDPITLADACETIFGGKIRPATLRAEAGRGKTGPMADNDKPFILLNLGDLAKELSIDARKLNRWIFDSGIEHYRVGHQKFFDIPMLRSIQIKLFGALTDTAAKTGFIYFMECAGFVKIGYSANPSKRMSELAVGNPLKISLIHTEPASQEMEKMLHGHFDAMRGHGEWFRFDRELNEFLEKRRAILAVENVAAAIEAM